MSEEEGKRKIKGVGRSIWSLKGTRCASCVGAFQRRPRNQQGRWPGGQRTSQRKVPRSRQREQLWRRGGLQGQDQPSNERASRAGAIKAQGSSNKEPQTPTSSNTSKCCSKPILFNAHICLNQSRETPSWGLWAKMYGPMWAGHMQEGAVVIPPGLGVHTHQIELPKVEATPWDNVEVHVLNMWELGRTKVGATHEWCLRSFQWAYKGERPSG